MRDWFHQRHVRLRIGAPAWPSEPRTRAEGTDQFDAAAANADEPCGLRLTPTCAGFMLAVD